MREEVLKGIIDWCKKWRVSGDGWQLEKGENSFGSTLYEIFLRDVKALSKYLKVLYAEFEKRKKENKNLKEEEFLKQLLGASWESCKTSSLKQILITLLRNEGYKWKEKDILLSFIKLLQKNGKEVLVNELLRQNKNLYSPGGLTALLAESFKGVNPNQLRKVFEAFKNLEDTLKKGNKDKVLENLYKIYPNLAYAKGRNLIPRHFYDVLVSLLEAVEEGLRTPNGEEGEVLEDVERLVQFVRSFVAYHKFFYGTKS